MSHLKFRFRHGHNISLFRVSKWIGLSTFRHVACYKRVSKSSQNIDIMPRGI